MFKAFAQIRKFRYALLELNNLNTFSERKKKMTTIYLLYKNNYYIGCPVRCSEKQMLKSPVKLLI